MIVFDRLRKYLHFLRINNARCLPILERTDDGFRMSNRRGRSIDVRWDDVDQIVTWKVDCMVHDEIYLAFHRRSTNSWVRIGEPQGPAFLDIGFAMLKHFPNIPETWYFDVMENAFARNLTVLLNNGDSGAIHSKTQAT